jgi:hypothetical protein
MTRPWLRPVLAGVLGALVGASALVLAVRSGHGFTIEMDRRLPGFATGFYPDERHRDETFAWTSGRAALTFEGIDRRATWQCAIRLRSGRPSAAEPPLVEVTVDGRPAMARAAPADYQEFTVGVPADGTWRLTIALSSPTFVPSGTDSRALGVQVDRVRCAPATSTRPSLVALLGAALPPAVFAATLSAGGLGSASLATILLLISLLQVVPLTLAPALYGRYGATAAALAAALAVAAMGLQKAAERWTRRPWQEPARLALAISVAALYLKLLALLHPSKPIIDAVFHAHRFEWVLGGRWFFTQPIQDAVQFPYAIGLYVFAAPWALLTSDHVSLLRIVVSTAEAVAGGLLYLMVARAWQDRWAGVAAVALFQGVPVACAVVGNANMTNAFGQSAALVTIAAATMWRLPRRHLGSIAGLIALAALAFLSHVSTFALLAGALGSMGLLGLWRGFRAAEAPAGAILVSTVAAGILAIALYYGHFPEVHRTFSGARAPIEAAAQDGPRDSSAVVPPVRETRPLSTRMALAARLAVTDIGWPILLLAAVGLWRLLADRARDRLALTLAGWAVAYVVFAAAGTFSRVDTRYERYALEFISRVDFATYPASVILAARGSLWIWRRGLAGRLASCALWIAAASVAYQHWSRWLG